MTKVNYRSMSKAQATLTYRRRHAAEYNRRQIKMNYTADAHELADDSVAAILDAVDLISDEVLLAYLAERDDRRRQKGFDVPPPAVDRRRVADEDPGRYTPVPRGTITGGFSTAERGSIGFSKSATSKAIAYCKGERACGRTVDFAHVLAQFQAGNLK